MQSLVAEFFQIRRAGRDVDVGEIGEHAVDAQPEERLIRAFGSPSWLAARDFFYCGTEREEPNDARALRWLRCCRPSFISLPVRFELSPRMITIVR